MWLLFAFSVNAYAAVVLLDALLDALNYVSCCWAAFELLQSVAESVTLCP